MKSEWDLLTQVPELRGLTLEQFATARRCHPGVALDDATISRLRDDAVLAWPIDKPGLWLRARLSRLELERGSEARTAQGVGKGAGGASCPVFRPSGAPDVQPGTAAAVVAAAPGTVCEAGAELVGVLEKTMGGGLA